MVRAIYKGNTMLSISYCSRKLEELEKKNTMAHICGYDVTQETFEKNPELQKLSELILHYRDIMKALLENKAEIKNDEQLISFIVEQIVLKIKEAEKEEVSISFSFVSEYTAEIKVDNIFSTEMTLTEKVYNQEWDFNDEYDGYHDTAEYISTTTTTSFLEDVASSIKNDIDSKLPEVSVSVISLR